MTRKYTAVLMLLIAALGTAAMAAAQGLPTATPESVGMSAQRLAQISEAFKQEIDKGNLPGVVVLVARKGRLVYSDALGYLDKDAGKPMTKDAIFRIYSMTKPLVSVAAMMLVEDGKIELTDPISKFLPAMKSMQVSVAKADSEFAKIGYTLTTAQREITVQDLLRHTAGLAYANLTQNGPVKEAYAKAGVDDDPRGLTPAEEVERMSKAPLAHEPGTVWEYSLASDMLGRVVEAASGKRLSDFLAERLFKPLAMNDTAFFVPSDKLNRLAEALPMDASTGKPNKLYNVTGGPRKQSGGGGGGWAAAA